MGSKSKKSRHKYDEVLIEQLCKKQPEEDFNATDVARKYCKKKGIEFTIYVARAIQYVIKKKSLQITLKKPTESDQYKSATRRVYNSKKRNAIITWAQARTPIDTDLWNNMLEYAKKMDAEVIVIPGTYLNPNSPYSDQIRREYVWDSRLSEYLYAVECNVHNHLITIADTDVVPTAKTPLTSFHSVTGLESCVIGHPRQHMIVNPTMKNSRRKFMFTTGSVTIPNYRRARVGKEAKTHHKMGFLFVEDLDGENFTARHVEADPSDGSFQDLIFSVKDGEVSINKNWEAMILGDAHLGEHDPDMVSEIRRVLGEVNCGMTVWHDLFNGHSINHHEAKDYVAQVIKAKKGLNNLQAELDMNVEFLKDWLDTKPVIIPSNHPDWIDKWVRLNQGIKDTTNAFLFNEFQKILFEEKAPKGLYAYYLEQQFGDKILCLDRDESFEVSGFELNNHGDLGANGAKGTPRTFKKLNTKIVSGDKHHPYTEDNAYGVGVLGLDHGYNRGLSNWAQTVGIILPNGTFQHLLYFNGKFTNLL